MLAMNLDSSLGGGYYQCIMVTVFAAPSLFLYEDTSIKMAYGS
jgi:hypothetical protein